MQTGFPFPKLEISGMDGHGVDVEKMESDKNYLKKNFPDLAYFLSCRVAQRNTKVTRKVDVDHPNSVQKHKNDEKKGNSEQTSAVDHSHSNKGVVASVKETVVNPPEEDDTTEEKGLEEYLLGGNSREKDYKEWILGVL